MNEVIEIIVYIIGGFISGGLNVLCYAQLNNHKLKLNIKNIIIILTFTIISTINVYLNNTIAKAIFNLIIVFMELELLFKDKSKKIVINYIVLFIITILLEILLTNSLLFLGVLINNTSANTATYINFLLTIAVGLIQYLIISINIIKISLRKLINTLNNTKNSDYIIFSMIIVIAVLGIINVENFANKNSLQLIFILIAIFIIIFVSIIKLKFKEEILKESNKKLIEYNDNYGKFLDEYKIYKHNINNKLSAMKAYGNKKVNALIDELLEEETNFSIKNNNLYNIPNGIKGIVAEKLYNKNYDILIDNKIKKDPFSKLSPKAFNNISECIGIALDNAIEAAEETASPIILLDLYEDKENIYIKIGNNYKNNIDLDEIGKKYYSTKKRGSGLGLFSIYRNKLVEDQITITNNIYYIELKIKKAR